MSLVSRSIPTLINGVSQQPNTLRLPTQAEAQENFFSSVVEGLIDRPPTQHITQLYNGTIGDANPHFINRSASERYCVLFRNGALTVHDLAGVQKTVNTPDGTSYLTCSDPSTDLRIVTLADYTFVLNRTVVAQLEAGVTAARPKEGLVFVKQGQYGAQYAVYVDGILRADKTTSTTNVADIATDVIAEDLRADLVTNLGAGWTITRNASVIHIQKASGDFTLKTGDGQGGANLQSFKDATQTFTSLPATAPTNFQIAVIGTAENQDVNYFVKFVPSTTGETFGEGAWEETVGFGVQTQINPATMPHLLVRENDGTFTFAQAAWDDLTVGDMYSAPAPSFIGNVIEDLFLFKSRLGILAGDSQIYSETGGYFNFWPTTVTTILDSDRIDYTQSHNKVPLLKNAVAFDEKTIVFSEQTQFVAQGNPTFTAKTMQSDPTTEFISRTTCKPVGLGKNLYFVFPREDESDSTVAGYDGIREYFVDSTTAVKDAVDITAQVPKYIPAGVFRLIPSSSESVLMALTKGDPTAIYVYKYFYAGEEKLQSSWFRFRLGTGITAVLGGEFINSVLYLVIQRGDGVYLEKMNFAPGVVDQGQTYITHLDRRVNETQCTVSYDSGTNYTTVTLPYQIDGTIKCVTREVNPGQLLTLQQTAPAAVRLVGDYSTAKLHFGQSFLRSYTLSKFYLREERGSTTVVNTTGRLQIRTAAVIYAKTGTFTVEIQRENSDTDLRVFTGLILGAGSTVLGSIPLPDGKYQFPVLCQNTQVTITIWTDSFLPCHLISVDWEGEYYGRARRG